MTINIDMRHLMHHSSPASSSPDWLGQIARLNTPPVPSSIVEISSAGKAKAAHSVSEIEAANALRDTLKQYDFTSMTPNQLAQLGIELWNENELSDNATAAFGHVALDTVQEPDPNKPMNMVEHFDMMLSVVTEAAQSDATLAFGVQFRQEASQALADLMSFVSSNRTHISTSR